MINVLINSLETRDPYTKEHSQHVSNLMALFYDALPQKYQQNITREILKTTGLLHDVGKLGIPDTILNKTEHLTQNEWLLMKSHTLLGRDLLYHMPEYKNIAEWIHYHHERVDGKGYFNKNGNEIPIASKIISITDTFSALVTDRPYRRGKSYEEAVSILKAVSGTQLDSELLQYFFKLDEDDIQECKPDIPSLKNIEELQMVESYINNFGEDEDLNLVLSRNTGMICIHKTIKRSRETYSPLALFFLKIDGILTIEDRLGYHKADNMIHNISMMIKDSVRKNDIITLFGKDKLMIAIPKCDSLNGSILIDRMLEQLKNSSFVKNCPIDLEFLFRQSYFSPEKDESFDEILGFLKNILTN